MAEPYREEEEIAYWLIPEEMRKYVEREKELAYKFKRYGIRAYGIAEEPAIVRVVGNYIITRTFPSRRKSYPPGLLATVKVGNTMVMVLQRKMDIWATLLEKTKICALSDINKAPRKLIVRHPMIGVTRFSNIFNYGLEPLKTLVIQYLWFCCGKEIMKCVAEKSAECFSEKVDECLMPLMDRLTAMAMASESAMKTLTDLQAFINDFKRTLKVITPPPEKQIIQVLYVREGYIEDKARLAKAMMIHNYDVVKKLMRTNMRAAIFYMALTEPPITVDMIVALSGYPREEIAPTISRILTDMVEDGILTETYAVPPHFRAFYPQPSPIKFYSVSSVNEAVRRMAEEIKSLTKMVRKTVEDYVEAKVRPVGLFFNPETGKFESRYVTERKKVKREVLVPVRMLTDEQIREIDEKIRKLPKSEVRRRKYIHIRGVKTLMAYAGKEKPPEKPEEKKKRESIVEKFVREKLEPMGPPANVALASAIEYYVYLMGGPQWIADKVAVLKAKGAADPFAELARKRFTIEWLWNVTLHDCISNKSDETCLMHEVIAWIRAGKLKPTMNYELFKSKLLRTILETGSAFEMVEGKMRLKKELT